MKNKVIATGLLINVFNKSDTTLKLQVLVVSSKYKNKYVDFIYDGSLGEDIHINDVVSIEGIIDGYNYVREDGRLIEMQFLRANKVSPAEGSLKKYFGIPDHFPPEHMFKAYIEGTVDLIEEIKENHIRIYLSIAEGKRGPYRVTMGLNNHKMIEDDFNSLSVGDKLVCYLNYNSVRKEINGVEKSLRYLVIEDFSIVK